MAYVQVPGLSKIFVRNVSGAKHRQRPRIRHRRPLLLFAVPYTHARFFGGMAAQRFQVNPRACQPVFNELPEHIPSNHPNEAGTRAQPGEVMSSNASRSAEGNFHSGGEFLGIDLKLDHAFHQQIDDHIAGHNAIQHSIILHNSEANAILRKGRMTLRVEYDNLRSGAPNVAIVPASSYSTVRSRRRTSSDSCARLSGA